MELELKLSLDDDGYLNDPAVWNEEVASELAMRDHIILTDAHWELIEAVRAYSAAYDHAPPMRPLVKWIAAKIGADKGSSIYLHKLFPANPAKQLARIAGLPKPTKCL